MIEHEPIFSFDEWNEKSSYFFGLLMADGSFRKRGNVFELRLRMKDFDIIQKYCNFLNLPTSRIKIEKVLYKNNYHYIHCINSSNKHLCKKIESLGLPLGVKYPIISFPETLNDELINHFIRGYFDGDGTVGIYNRKDSKKPLYRFAVAGSNIQFLEKIKNYLPLNKGKIILSKNTNNLLYSISKENFILIREFLYKNSTVFLDRKQNIFYSVK